MMLRQDFSFKKITGKVMSEIEVATVPHKKVFDINTNKLQFFQPHPKVVKVIILFYS